MDRQFLSAMLFNLPKISDFAECLFILFRELFPLSVAIFLHPTAVRLCLSKHAKRIFSAIEARVNVINFTIQLYRTTRLLPVVESTHPKEGNLFPSFILNIRS